MAGQSSASKGNGASKRMSNTNLQAKRARSWVRGQAKKKRNEAANQARAAANLSALKELGGKQQPYERVVERDGKTLTRTKMESPGSALARTKREQEAR
jgi:hypothetical protein